MTCERVELGTLVSHRKGYAFKSKTYQDMGNPVVRVSNFTNDSISMDDLKFVSEDIAKENESVKLKEFDVVIATVGSWPNNPSSIVGKTIAVPSSLAGALLNQNSVRLRVLSNLAVDQEYLFYALKTQEFSDYLVSTAQGSANQASITLKDILKYEIPWPKLVERKNIVSIAGGLRRKIELNRQTNQTLENIAQAIFKSWFVDFDPTRAKIAAKKNGQDPELAAMAAIAGKEVNELETLSGDQLEKLQSTAALFPDNFEDSELGEIPEGWSIGSVGDIALAKGGYAFKGKSFVDEGHPVVKIKNITGDGRVDLTGAVCINDEQASSSKRFKLNDGDLLMAMTGATVGKIGFVTTGGKAVYLNQRVAKFESERFGRKISWFLFCCFGRSSIFDSVVGAAQGSAQPNISSSGIEATQLVMPSHELIEEFSNKSDSLFKKWLCNIDENAGLEQLRDTILPKLLSGELDLSEQEKAVVNG